MLAVFTFPIWIFSARTIDRLGKGIRNSARDALLSDESTPQIKGKVFGFHRGMDTLGAAIGPVVALIYLYFYPENYKWLFVIAFAPGLIAVALTLFLKEKRIVTNPKEKNIGFFSFFSVLESITQKLQNASYWFGFIYTIQQFRCFPTFNGERTRVLRYANDFTLHLLQSGICNISFPNGASSR